MSQLLNFILDNTNVSHGVSYQRIFEHFRNFGNFSKLSTDEFKGRLNFQLKQLIASGHVSSYENVRGRIYIIN